MAKVPKKAPLSKDSSEKRTKAAGRPPAKRAQEYLWYRNVSDFRIRGDTAEAVWWETIDWEDEARVRRARRKFTSPGSNSKRIHAGFLWETVRRFPELNQLINAKNMLAGHVQNPEEMTLGEGIADQAARSQANCAFIQAHGMELNNALRILCDNWKFDFESLTDDDRNDWISCHQVLWHAIGDSGSVPALPVDLPTDGPDSGRHFGQGITAFDLLIEANGGGAIPATDFLDQPLPALSLKSFARLNPTESGKGVEAGVGTPDSYPWVSFGILLKQLKKTQLYPMALAINLYKDDESIVRDLMEIVRRKRRFLGLAVADRRIRRESFDKISALDREVLGNEGVPPHSQTFKEFEKSARLDLRRLVESLNNHVSSIEESEEDADHYQKVYGILTTRPIADPELL